MTYFTCQQNICASNIGILMYCSGTEAIQCCHP